MDLVGEGVFGGTSEKFIGGVVCYEANIYVSGVLLCGVCDEYTYYCVVHACMYLFRVCIYVSYECK